MSLYLYNTLNRLKKFSKSLDKKELFVDKPWVIIDENINQQKYIFKRDGELIMSLNGKVEIGKWEYISAAKGILIDRIQDKILLNQSFIDPAVMALKMDGLNDNILILANENIIPDLDVVTYIKNLYYQKYDINTVKLKDGNVLEIYNYNGNVYSLYSKNVRIKGESVKDGKYVLADSNIRLKIEGSKVKDVLELKTFNTNKGVLVIECGRNLAPIIGDLVYLDNLLAPDGVYRIGLFRKITVKSGVIIK